MARICFPPELLGLYPVLPSDGRIPQLWSTILPDALEIDGSIIIGVSGSSVELGGWEEEGIHI